MLTNYILLAVTGLYTLFGIISWIKGTVGVRPIRVILFGIIFILVLIATLMGMDYNSFRAMIEGR